MKRITTDELKRITAEGLVLQGCGGDPDEWLNGINETLTEEGFLLNGDTFKDAYVFTHDGLTNILFSMENVDLHAGKLAAWRITSHDTFGGTWLSDYLPNRLDVEMSDPAPASEERPPAPIRAYIENIHDDSIGGFTIPLPTTKTALQPWLSAIEAGDFRASNIAIRDVYASIPELEEILQWHVEHGIDFDELNYLAAKISGLEQWGADLFPAALDSGRYNNSLSDLINLVENTPRLDLEPAFSEAQYGEHHIQMMKDNTANAFGRLEQSNNQEERDLAQYVLRLEAHVDAKAYGRGVIAEENGVFTKYGYLTERGPFQEIYRGPEDIPREHCIFSHAEQAQEKLVDEAQQDIAPAHKPSVLEQIAAARAERSAEDAASPKPRGEQKKSHEEER